MNQNFGIHWFRRDLRIVGNNNLRFNWKQNNGRVLGLFCFDSNFLKRSDFSVNRFAFFLKTLKQLKAELQMQGGDLLVVDSAPDEAIKNIFKYFVEQKIPLPNTFSFGRDYEPFARARDQKITELIQNFKVQIQSERDHLIIEPQELLKDDGSFYQVYSPYAKKWFSKLQTTDVQQRINQQQTQHQYYEKLKANKLEKIFNLTWASFKNLPYRDSLDSFIEINNKKISIPIPPAGFAVAYECLMQFQQKVNDYKDHRDSPFLEGTSRMSVYQKNGSYVSSQIMQMLDLKDKQFFTPDKATQYVKEIAWREFYYSIMYHRPDCEKSCFLKQYNELKWQNNSDWFQSWCEGRTGFPIVDAGMRQLNTTGWMHNRVRMIVASFLVKDLHIDWRWGENYFMKMLLDGDLAPNNGGWQWAASTGCDPQPYFRVFNPWLQSKKFDPEAQYIKTYVPELRNVNVGDIHDPDGNRYAAGYNKPIVQHALQKMKAIKLFKDLKEL